MCIRDSYYSKSLSSSSSSSSSSSFNWISQFTSKLNNDVALIGPSINIEVSPHIQTYAVGNTILIIILLLLLILIK